MLFLKVLLILGSVTISFSTQAQQKDITVIGDSHSVYFTHGDDSHTHLGRKSGHLLNADLEYNNYRVHNYSIGGSTAESWSNSQEIPYGSEYHTDTGHAILLSPETKKNFQQLCQKQSCKVLSLHPPLGRLCRNNKCKELLIQLGDNVFLQDKKYNKEIGQHVYHKYVVPEPIGENKDKYIAAMIQKIKPLVDQIPQNSNCNWVGPTYHLPAVDKRENSEIYSKPNEQVDLMYEVLEQALAGKCQVIDSRKCFDDKTHTPQAPFDGLHLGRADSYTWGQCISNLLKLKPDPAIRKLHGTKEETKKIINR